MIHHRILRGLIVIFIGALSVQCGKDGLSNQVTFVVIPNDPVVVLEDLIIPDGDSDITVPGPWFQFQYEIQNNSPNPLIIATVAFRVRYVRNFVPQVEDLTLNRLGSCPDGIPDADKRIYFAVLPAESPVFTGYADQCQTTFPLNPPSYESRITGGMPEADRPNYRIEVILNGWFTESASNDVAVERFTKSAFIFAR